jgi:hypothetical protein
LHGGGLLVGLPSSWLWGSAMVALGIVLLVLALLLSLVVSSAARRFL